jgi:hypothetical protein
MKKAQIGIGTVYMAKVSGNLCPVQIISSSENYAGRTQWTARNLSTGRVITIRSAQRLRPARLSPSHPAMAAADDFGRCPTCGDTHDPAKITCKQLAAVRTAERRAWDATP